MLLATVASINILGDQQQDISNQYAKKGSHDLDTKHYQLGVSGMPLLNGAIASFECEVDVCHDGGDHIIMVGKVIAMNRLDSDNAPSPLVFHAGQYRELKV